MDTAVLKTYIYIVDEGSFAAASRRMGISKSLASKYISDLEANLGARLLTRTTRSVTPTDLGQEYYVRVKQVLADLDLANEVMRQASGRVSGRLRIAAPTSYMLKVLNTQVMGFIEAYPEVQLDLILDEGTGDGVSERYDAAVRVGDLEDSAMFAKRLRPAQALVVASPAYLAEFGTPQAPADLVNHRCLHFSNMRGAETWQFRYGSETLFQKVHPFFSANSSEMIRAAALEGKGIAMVVDFVVAEDLREGRLVQVLPEYVAWPLPVNLVYPSNRNMTSALRAFMDYLGKAQG